MARFTESNRIAASERTVIDLRRPGIVLGGLVPVARALDDRRIFNRPRP